MRKPLKKNGLPFKQWLVACSVVNLLFILVIVIFQKNLPPQVPLFYGLAEGEEQLAPRILLILPNLTALLVMLINLVLVFFNHDLFIKKTLIMVSVATTVLAAITTFKILFLVGSF